MSNQHKKILNHLSIIARDVTPVAGARIASALVYKREILALGICENKTHPLQDKYNRHPEARFLHSEIACIKNAVRLGVDEDTFKRSTLYVCRQKIDQQAITHNGRTKVTKKWTSGLACPCEGCASAIIAFDIGSVIYSLDNEGYAVYE